MAENIGVVGAGSWGMALAYLLAQNGHNVTVWSRREEAVQQYARDHENKDKLPGVILPDSVSFTSSIEQITKGQNILVLVVPSTHVRETVLQMKPYITNDQIIVNCAKGIEESSLLVMSQVIRDVLSSDFPRKNIADLSGPSHAEEVGRGVPTTIVLGSESESVAKYLQKAFMSDVFRVYISPDMKGIEIGAACKNVIALAAGIADGLGYGDNSKAALITRGIAEITRLGIAAGGKPETFAGLSGIGDLIVTCASMHSRNRRAGILIGQGRTMQEAMDEVHMVVEGVYSAKAALRLSKLYDVEMPIVAQVCEVLFNGKSAREAVTELMLRDAKIENYTLEFPED